ncbi:unnamed protein product [Ambrosiozyma monospora]|uniref:Unnamed protein product n=1 Tax=Ambrosiozyma monospora TaxID=43982 RepID=A0ACB5T9H8_AMBMO|nr:unnamed protein product [Ambrosiozyma monospora]
MRFSQRNPKLKTVILVTSIGNPSPEYDFTRHSVGHFMIDKYIERHDDEIKSVRVGGYTYKYLPDPEPEPEPKPEPEPEVAKRGELKSDSQHVPKKRKKSKKQKKHTPMFFHKLDKGYMNLSGKPLTKLWNDFLKTMEQQNFNPVLAVLHDELDLELGKVKVKQQNVSHKGHNGLRSIQEHMGKGYNAVPIGIGRNYPGGDARVRDGSVVAKYVLSKFSYDEQDVLTSIGLDNLEEAFDKMKQEKYIFDKA